MPRRRARRVSRPTERRARLRLFVVWGCSASSSGGGAPRMRSLSTSVFGIIAFVNEASDRLLGSITLPLAPAARAKKCAVPSARCSSRWRAWQGVFINYQRALSCASLGRSWGISGQQL